VDDEAAPGLPHRREHQVAVPRGHGTQVDELDRVVAVPLGERVGRLAAAVHERAPGDHRDAFAGAQHRAAAERHDEVVARVRRAPVARHQQRAVLEEDGRVGRAHGRAQQADRVGGVARHRHLPAEGVREPHLVAERVPRVADVLAEAAGHADDDRRREAVVGPPAHGAAVVELLGGRVGVLAELDLGDRDEPRVRHPHRAADDPLLRQRGVEHAAGAEALLQPLGHEVHAPLHADVLAEHEEPRVDLELAGERAPDGLGEAQRGPGGGRHVAPAQRAPLGLAEAPHRVGVARLGRLGDDEALHARRVAHRPGPRRAERALHVAGHLGLERGPLGLGHHVLDAEGAQPRQRVAGLVGGDRLGRAVRLLVVGPRVAGEARHGEPHEGRPAPGAHVVDALGQQPRGVERVGAVAVAQEEVAERREVRGDVGARRLEGARHRDAQPVVLDVEEHRESERRGHRQRRPEPARRDARLAAEGHAEGAAPGRVAELVAVVQDALRPARHRRVLPADVARHGQHLGPGAAGRLHTTPMSRPSLKPPERPSGLASASSAERPSERSSGRER
jgi:hypothetical protein